MANEPAHLLARHLQTLTTAARIAGLTDRELIQRFVAGCDEDAFAALVRRHGLMVLRVCHRILHNDHDAEDVFQATFLVLSRKAASLRRRDSVGCFLHGVAYRLALKARARLAQQRMHENRVAVEKHAGDPLADLSVREAQAILDEELARLPEKYREPLVLCCLEGRTRDEAARQLGWSAKLVKSRLEQGRERLRSRLCRRGLTLPTVLAAALLTEEAASAALPAILIRAAVEAARTSNGVSTSVMLLTESALGSMAIGKAKIVLFGLLLLTGALVLGAGAFAPPETAEKQAETPSEAKAQEIRRSQELQRTRTDRYGDPLPSGAIARIGTVRFRESGALFTLAYSRDGKLLASATGDQRGVVRIWDAATGKERLLLQPRAGQVYSIAFSPDGKKLASIGTGKDSQSAPVCVWDIATGKRLWTFRQPSWGYDVAFSPDDRRLAVAGRDNTVHFWDLQSGQDVLQLKGHQGLLWSLAFSADGKMLATGSDDKTIRLWDAVSGKELRRLIATKRSAPYVAFSPDSKVVAGGSNDGSVHLWDTATGRERLTIPGHDKWQKPRGFTREGPAPVVFSPDGQYLAAGYEGIVYDAATGKERCQLEEFHRWIRSLVFSPDGKILAGEASRRIRFWDAATGKEIFKDTSHRDAVTCTVFSPDGKQLYTASYDGSVGAWDAATGQERFRFQAQCDWAFQGDKIALSPDGTKAAAWLAGELFSWDVRKPKPVREHSDEVDGYYSKQGLTFSPQGIHIAASFSSKDERIRLWANGAAKEPLLLEKCHSGGNGLVFSPDGKIMASGSSDGTASLWEVATGKNLCNLPGVKGHPGPTDRSSAAVFSLAFSPDGKTLALGGSDGTIGLWDKASSREIRSLLPSSGGWVWALAFSPDGKTLAAGYRDGTIRFWEFATGKIRRQWATQSGVILSLTFSPDGKLLASAGSDTTVLIWTADEQTKPRDLSAEELDVFWRDLAGDEAVMAYRAIGILCAASGQTIPFLKAHLHPVAEVDARRLARLIADLDDEHFSVREKASAELAKYGDQAEAALRKTLEGKPSLEARRRIQAILEGLNRPPSGEPVRQLRAVEILERIGTLPAQVILQSLAEGAPQAILTREAKATLERLMRRPTAAP